MKQGWEIKKLGEVANTNGRIGWKGLTAKEYTKEGPLFLSVHSLNFGDYVDFSQAFHISQARYDESPEIMLKKDDILICKDGAGIGKLGIVPGLLDVTTINSSLLLIRCKKNVLTKYLYYNLLSPVFQSIVQSRLSGATTPHLYQRDIVTFPILLPKLPEQKRIVAILDKAFAAIAKAKANAEQNLKNAKELFQSKMQSIFNNGKLKIENGEWEEKTLGEIAFVKSGGTPLRAKKEYWEGDIAWYSSGELNDIYTKEPERHINELAINNSSAKLFPKGSLLIGMYDTAALKMSIIDRDATFNQAIAGVEPNNKIDLIFILHSINSIKPKILNLRRGVRQKNLNLTKIKNIPIFLPHIFEQNTIVKKLEALSAETKKLEAIYQQKIEDLEELKKSVLQKAFLGQLKMES